MQQAANSSGKEQLEFESKETYFSPLKIVTLLRGLLGFLFKIRVKGYISKKCFE